MKISELSTAQIQQLLIADFDGTADGECALDIYTFAKRVEAAVKNLLADSQKQASQILADAGGKFENQFCKATIRREFETTFEENETRSGLLATVENLSAELKAKKTALAEFEKAMLKEGEATRTETGFSLSVSLF